MTEENNVQSSAKDPGELVKVFISNQETETQVILGLLESADIECVEMSFDAVQDMYPGVGGTAVCVSPEDEAEALGIIEDYRANAENDIKKAEAEDAK